MSIWKDLHEIHWKENVIKQQVENIKCSDAGLLQVFQNSIE